MSIYGDSHYNVLEGNSLNLQDFGRQFFHMIMVEDELGGRHIIYPAVFSNFSLRKSEGIQVVKSFNEVNHLYAFGKDPDVLQLSGYIFSSNVYNFSFALTNMAITDHYQQVLRAFSAAQQGLRTKITGPSISGWGKTILTGVATELTMQMSAEQHNVMQFGMNFISVDSVMGVGAEQRPTSIKTSGTFNIYV